MNSTSGIRYARKKIVASCLMIHQGNAYIVDVCNMSASGILLSHENQDFRDDMGIGSICVLEIVVNDTFNLHVESEIIRMDDSKIGFHYTSIPEEKQVALWQLLGEHVHETETMETY